MLEKQKGAPSDMLHGNISCVQVLISFALVCLVLSDFNRAERYLVSYIVNMVCPIDDCVQTCACPTKSLTRRALIKARLGLSFVKKMIWDFANQTRSKF